MNLRAATSADADLVYEIKRLAYADYVIRSRGHWDEVFQRNYTRQNLPYTLILHLEETLVGWIAYREDVAFEILDIHLLPAHQNRGLGSQLIAHLIQQADERQKAIVLHVLKINPSHALYRRLGFLEIGADATHLKMHRSPR